MCACHATGKRGCSTAQGTGELAHPQKAVARSIAPLAAPPQPLGALCASTDATFGEQVWKGKTIMIKYECGREKELIEITHSHTRMHGTTWEGSTGRARLCRRAISRTLKGMGPGHKSASRCQNAVPLSTLHSLQRPCTCKWAFYMQCCNVMSMCLTRVDDELPVAGRQRLRPHDVRVHDLGRGERKHKHIPSALSQCLMDEEGRCSPHP